MTRRNNLIKARFKQEIWLNPAINCRITCLQHVCGAGSYSMKHQFKAQQYLTDVCIKMTTELDKRG